MLIMADMLVTVLRLGHRPQRDKRVSTHVALAARAFGASSIIYSGSIDQNLEKSVEKITNQWGGPFKITYEKDWKRVIHEWKAKGGEVIHLTMYGLHIDNVIGRIIKSERDKLVVVGAEKVPSEIFNLADFNIAIGFQPHSEIASLAIFLDRLFEGKNLYKKFADAKLEIIPQPRGKKVCRK